ncbi:hypothetical protein JNJ66_05080 [Candidatus Saccharibacteria bacterium]|nr:hypothetical protein [Candidatus Saccharibacteria bacterium]
MAIDRRGGFTAIDGLLVAIVIAVIGFIGWRVYDGINLARSQADDAATIKPARQLPPRKLAAFKEAHGWYSLEYPQDWRLRTDDRQEQVGGKPVSNISITSSDGNVLRITLAPEGPPPEACTPDADDRPHTAGNNCVSMTYSVVEKLDTSVRKKIGSTGAYIVMAKLSGYGKTETGYTVGLLQSKTEPPVDTPVMGDDPDFSVSLRVPGQESPYQLSARAESHDPAFLNSDDAAYIKAVLQSLRLE